MSYQWDQIRKSKVEVNVEIYLDKLILSKDVF